MNVMNNHVTATNLLDRHGRLREGNYMHSSNGMKFWPFNPLAEEVSIDVIAHQLAGQNRWQGAVQHKHFIERIFYSVAEHSVYCAMYMIHVLKRPDLALEALLHDASEAYIGDLIRPLKYHPVFRAPFLEVEQKIELVVAERFNLVYAFPKEVKMADEAVGEAESRQIVPRSDLEEWESGKMHNGSVCAPVEIQMLEPYKAKLLFLDTYRGLIAERSNYRELPAELLAA